MIQSSIYNSNGFNVIWTKLQGREPRPGEQWNGSYRIWAEIQNGFRLAWTAVDLAPLVCIYVYECGLVVTTQKCLSLYQSFNLCICLLVANFLLLLLFESRKEMLIRFCRFWLVCLPCISSGGAIVQKSQNNLSFISTVKKLFYRNVDICKDLANKICLWFGTTLDQT